MPSPTHAKPPTPEGCMTLEEAAVALGLGRQTIRDRLRLDQMPHVTVAIPTSTGKWIRYRFPKREGVLALQGAPRKAKAHPKVKRPTEAPKRLLTHPSDSVALEARRELWARNNRKLRI